MAWISGTATDAADLFNKLITFLTSDATLVAGSEAWTLLRRDTFTLDAKRDLAELRGPGSSAGDAIYVQVCLFADAAGDSHRPLPTPQRHANAILRRQPGRARS